MAGYRPQPPMHLAALTPPQSAAHAASVQQSPPLTLGQLGDSSARRLMTSQLGSTPAVERLHKVKQSLNNLPTSLKDDIDQRKGLEESRLLEVRELATRIEKHLMLEVKRRTEADKVIQSQLEAKVREIGENVDRAHSDKLKQMQGSIDLLTKRLLQLEKELAEERERTSRLAAELRHAATNSTSDLKAALEQEKVNRMEKEAQILKKISEDVYKVQEGTDIERQAREASVAALREEFSKTAKTKEKADDKLRAKVLDDLGCLKAAIRIESEARQSSEEQLAQTMDTIVSQVQESLKVVSR